MCYYVTVGVRSGEMRRFRKSVPRGMRALSIANRSVLRHLPKGYEAALIVTGEVMCSCPLFRTREDRGATGPDIEGMRRKYRKKGWSGAKIERALASSLACHHPVVDFLGLREDLREFLATAAEQVGSLAIMVHWYDEHVEYEKCRPNEGPRLTPGELRHSLFPAQTDMIVWVTAKAPGR